MFGQSIERRGFQSREDFKAERISKQRGFQSREDFKAERIPLQNI
jgi:hypothetical protein